MTTTTTTRMSTLRGAPSQHAMLRSHARSVPSTTQPTTAERFLQHMLEEPHLAEFYTNIWGTDNDDNNNNLIATTDTRKQQRARRSRARRRASGSLVDIAQVAHVITTMTDYRSDYEPLPAMDATVHATTNLWTDDDDADTNSVVDSESDSDAAMPYDLPIMSLHTSRSAAHHATVRSALPFRISEASDEGSIVDDARAAAAASAGLYRVSKAPRMSDPLEGDASDSDSSRSVAQATKAASMNSAATMSMSDHGGNTRSTTSLLLISNADVQVVSASAHTPVPPPSTHNGSVVFSTVFSQDHKWNWASKFLLGLHEPMRHALFVMDRFLAQSDQAQQQTQRQLQPQATPMSAAGLEKHVREFFAWFKAYFVEYLTCQHKVKTTVLQPLIQLRHATKLEITTTYDEIFDVVAQIERQERQLSLSITRDPVIWHIRLENLQAAIRRLYLTMHAVLNLEEKTMHPALSATFSERTFHQYVMPRVFRSIKAKRVVVPWILERSKFWGGEGEQQSIQGMLPFSAKFLYRKFWRPYFINNVASAMKNLNEFVDPASSTAAVRPEAPSAGGCTVM